MRIELTSPHYERGIIATILRKRNLPNVFLVAPETLVVVPNAMTSVKKPIVTKKEALQLSEVHLELAKGIEPP